MAAKKQKETNRAHKRKAGRRQSAGRPRGAPVGNLNALKHGFYSRAFLHKELADLDEDNSGLEAEVKLTRVALRRVAELMQRKRNVEDVCALMSAIGVGAMRVGSLLKIKRYLSGEGDSNASALEAMIKAVAEELDSQIVG